MALWLRNYHRETLGGELVAWRRTTPAGRQLVCESCPRCGTRLFHQMADQLDTLSIKPGTLDTALDLEPVAQIWTSSARSWLQLPAGTLSYRENPATFDEIFSAWQARKGGSILLASAQRQSAVVAPER